MSGGRAAVFLDRDGTVLEEARYLSDPDGVVPIPGAVASIDRLRDAGLAVVIVTNQSGIARGLYGEADYQAVARRFESLLADAGAPLDGTYYCPHHPDHSGPCDCRKPATGMYRTAAAELGLDLTASYYVGDKTSDVIPALRLGGVGILVRTGYGRESERALPRGARVADDLAEATDWILSEEEARRRAPDTG